jgi:hypothetical protein
MHLITPFDLIEMFNEGQRLVVVGNGPSLRGSALGSWIDSHDLIVRFNECAVQAYETDVGSRTDILVSNPYPEKRIRPLLDGISAPKIVLILSPQTRRGDRNAFAKWIGEHPVLFSYTPDIRSVYRDRRDIALTTGTYALSLLSNLLKPSQVAIVGFTLFLGETSNHYWTTESPGGLAAHNPSREAEIFVELVNSLRTRVEVGADLEWVSEMVQIPLRKGISVRQLVGWAPPSDVNQA